MPDCQPDQIKRSTFISSGESRARSNSGGGEKEDLVTLAFLSFFVVCSELHYCVSASPVKRASRGVFKGVVYVRRRFCIYQSLCKCLCVKPRCEQILCGMFSRAPCREHSRQHFITAWLPYAAKTEGCFGRWGRRGGSNLVHIHLVIQVTPHPPLSLHTTRGLMSKGDSAPKRAGLGDRNLFGTDEHLITTLVALPVSSGTDVDLPAMPRSCLLLMSERATSPLFEWGGGNKTPSVLVEL